MFPDITPTTPRPKDRAPATRPGQVPGCFLSAAQRPELITAVLEKRRQRAADKNGARKQKESR